VPLGKLAVQLVPQLMPAGELVTVPAPLPALLAVKSTGCRPKSAVTVVAALSVTVQAPVPVHPPPLHPLKSEPASGAAVSVTMVPLGKLAEQLVPQLMPAGELVTVPTPLPALLTMRARVGSMPVPSRTRETVSPAPANVRFAVAVAAVVGLKRTVTVWVASPPARVN
jgi:hypothetical protein